jgi:PAS domain S-box-containing protein
MNTALSPEIDFGQLVAAAGDAIVVSNPDGVITFWNASAERIFGFSTAEAVGQTLDLITPERQRQRHWDGYHKTMRTGQTKYGSDLLRVPALNKSGTPLSIAFTVALLHDANNVVTSIVAIIRDETRRWNDEREMRQRLAATEARAVKAEEGLSKLST